MTTQHSLFSTNSRENYRVIQEVQRSLKNIVKVNVTLQEQLDNELIVKLTFARERILEILELE